MKKNALFWIFRQIRSSVPAVLALVGAQVIHALFYVFFALGSRGVIDSAVAGDMAVFWKACIRQAGIILVILTSLTVTRHLRDRLNADLDRDWKQNLLRGLLHGEYEAVSSYHSAELLNRLNNDVAKVNDGVLTLRPARLPCSHG